LLSYESASLSIRGHPPEPDQQLPNDCPLDIPQQEPENHQNCPETPNHLSSSFKSANKSLRNPQSDGKSIAITDKRKIPQTTQNNDRQGVDHFPKISPKFPRIPFPLANKFDLQNPPDLPLHLPHSPL
jgi:hypothetical protein